MSTSIPTCFAAEKALAVETSDSLTGPFTGIRFPPGWIMGAVALLNPAGEVQFANEAMTQFLHLPSPLPSSLGILNALEKCFPGSRDLLKNRFQNVLPWQTATLKAENDSGSSWYELQMARNDSGWFLLINSILPAAGTLQETIDSPSRSDTTGRNLWVRLLRAEAQLDNLVQRWPGVIFSQRADLGFFFVSPKIEELTGISVADWRSPLKSFWQIVHEADAEELQKHLKSVLKAEAGLTTTYRIRNAKSGRVAYIMEHRKAVKSESGLLLGYEGLWLDVTRQSIAEKRLSSAAWKETIAVLTMGLAHDFSNIMAGILALTEDFLSQMEKDHPFREGIQLIRGNSLQASQLVQRILHLHHGKPGEKNYQDLNTLTSDIVDLVRKVVPRSVQCKVSFHPESLPIYVDMVEFRQTVINLALNAVDAMPKGGTICFSTSRHTEEEAPVLATGPLPRLPAVRLSISDTGYGIPSHHLQTIFDPFFTTKAANKGSGLGLYNSRLFVEKHHGAISVDSVIGEGSTFHLWLPESDFTEGETEPLQEGHRRTLLLLGQPSQANDYLLQILRQGGYYVVTAKEETQAMQYLQSPEYCFSAIVAQIASQTDFTPSFHKKVFNPPGPIKLVLQVVARNQDELDHHLLSSADLILSGDTPAEDLLLRLRELWESEKET